MLQLDLNRDGKTQGWIYVSYTTNESGASRIEVPLTSLRNGTGPRVLCSAGVHGDDFEGQIVLSRLLDKLKPGQVRGQLIVAPAVNAPSVAMGVRCSPLDKKNLNQLFPGDPNGSPTQKIVHFFESGLIAHCDYMIDLQGGGNTMLLLSGPAIVRSDDAAVMATRLKLLKTFGAPRGYVFDEDSEDEASISGACRRHDVIRLGTQIGGGGLVSAANVTMMEEGLLRVLAHLRVIDDALLAGLSKPQDPVILHRPSPGSNAYVYAPEDGLFVPTVELGDEIEAGAILGEICWPDRPERSPIAIPASRSGTIVARCRAARVSRGDCMLVFAAPEAG